MGFAVFSTMADKYIIRPHPVTADESRTQLRPMANRYHKVAQAKLGHRAGSTLNHSHAKTEEAASFTHHYQKERLRANLIGAAGRRLIIQYRAPYPLHNSKTESER